MYLLSMIPIIGWFTAAVLCFFVAIPMFFLWNALAPIYFTFLPGAYMLIPFWHVFGLIWLLSALRALLLPSITSSSSTKEKIVSHQAQ